MRKRLLVGTVSAELSAVVVNVGPPRTQAVVHKHSKPEPASVTTRAITTVAPKPKIAVIH